jgi:hypothetical protein
VTTRTIAYSDGRREIVQVLDDGRLEEWSEDDPLSFEASIMWLEDVTRLPYVRVKLIRHCTSRRGELNVSGSGRIVGYSKLTANAHVDPETQCYARRLFYLLKSDYEQTGSRPLKCPHGAVDPTTVLPGVVGEPPRGPLKEMPPIPVVQDIDESRLKKQSGSMDDDVMEWMVESTPSGSSKRTDLHARPNNDESYEEEADDEEEVVRGYLLPKSGGQSIPLSKTTLTIGQLENCDVVLPFNSVSGIHCELKWEGGCWTIKDRKSATGVSINGIRIESGQRKKLEPGTLFAVGNFQFEIHYSSR